MGAAYRGRLDGAQGFAREFVLKCQLPGAKKHMKLFIAEAKIGAFLRHENVVSVSEFFEAEGALWLVMEYVRGVDLAKLIRVHRRLSLRLALYIVRAIALGLHHAHEAKDPVTGKWLVIVHRDMSPDNVLLSFEGIVKVTDFGVARADGVRTATQLPDRKLIGKFSYMDPVMLKNLPVDRRADVYAVSVILWELLAGQLAFPPMTSMFAVMAKVAAGDVAQLRAVAPGLPEALYSLVERGMALDPEQRTKNCREIAQTIERIFPQWFMPDALRETQEELGRLVEQAMQVPDEQNDGDENEDAPPPAPAPAGNEPPRPPTLVLPDEPPPATRAGYPPPRDHAFSPDIRPVPARPSSPVASPINNAPPPAPPAPAPVAQPWQTTMRPVQNPAELERASVPREEIQDAGYTKYSTGPQATAGAFGAKAVSGAIGAPPAQQRPQGEPVQVDYQQLRDASRASGGAPQRREPDGPVAWPAGRTPLLDSDDAEAARARRASRPTVPSNRAASVPSAPAKRSRAPLIAAAVVIALASAGVVGVTLLRHGNAASATPAPMAKASTEAVNAPAPAPSPSAAPAPAVPSLQSNAAVVALTTPPAEPQQVAPKHRRREHAPVAAASEKVSVSPEAVELMEKAEKEVHDGHYKDAIVSASEAIKRGAGADAYALRGGAEYYVGKRDDAARDWQAALKIDPENKDARYAMEYVHPSAKVVIEPPATKCEIDGVPVGDAPIERPIVANDQHAYQVELNVDSGYGRPATYRGYGGNFTVGSGKTIHLTPALDALLSDMIKSYQDGRVATAEDQAQRAIDLAKKAHDEKKAQAAWRILGAASCRVDHTPSTALHAVFVLNADADRAFVERACKDAGVQLNVVEAK
jgi:serine/threonine-protein kinase